MVLESRDLNRNRRKGKACGVPDFASLHFVLRATKTWGDVGRGGTRQVQFAHAFFEVPTNTYVVIVALLILPQNVFHIIAFYREVGSKIIHIIIF